MFGFINDRWHDFVGSIRVRPKTVGFWFYVASTSDRRRYTELGNITDGVDLLSTRSLAGARQLNRTFIVAVVN